MIVLLFGPPGSGKGTQAAVVAQQFDIPHISTGELLRAEVDNDTALGREVGPLLSAGELVSDDLMVRVVEHRLTEPDAQKGALLDGFPRTVPQAEALEAMLHHTARGVDVVVSLDVAEDLLLARILHRGEIGGRADDNPEAFALRMATYRHESAPVLDYYRGIGTTVEQIDGVGTVEEVTQRVIGVLAAVGRGVQAS